jgi:hypothetical protein
MVRRSATSPAASSYPEERRELGDVLHLADQGRICDLASRSQYTETIIARSARDYVCILARTPTIVDERYRALVAKVKERGYDVGQVQKAPLRP